MRYLILASPIFLAACGEPIQVGAPPPPREWLVCEELPAKPDLKPLEAIALPDGRMVYSKTETDARDAQIAAYVVNVRGAWFSCSENLTRVRNYHGG